MKSKFLHSVKNALFNQRTLDTISQSFSWTIFGGAPQDSPLGGLLLQCPPFKSIPTCCPVCSIKKNVSPFSTSRQGRGPLQEDSSPVATASDTECSRHAGSSVMQLSTSATPSHSPSAHSHHNLISPPGPSELAQLLDVTPRRRFSDFPANSWQCTGRGAYMPSAATTMCMETTQYVLQHGPWMMEVRELSVSPAIAYKEEFRAQSLPQHSRQLGIPSPPGLPQTLSLTTLTMTSVREWLSHHEIQETGLIGAGVSANIHRSLYGDEEVIVKVFKSHRAFFLDVLREADIARYMGALGVAPPLKGLVQFPYLPVPSIVSVSLPRAKDFSTMLRTHQFDDVSDIFDLLMQVARLLTVIHSHGFLHNDIKANNILVVPLTCRCPENPCTCIDMPANLPGQPWGATGMQGYKTKYRAYLIDFGTSTYRTGFLYHITPEDKQRFMYFSYLAPEVVHGTKETSRTTEKSDVYSFAMLMYEVCEKTRDQRIIRDITDLYRDCIKPRPNERPPMADCERILKLYTDLYKQRARSETAMDFIEADEGEEVVTADEGEEFIEVDEGEEFIEVDEGEEFIEVDDGEEVIEADEGEEVFEADDGEEVIEADGGEEVIEADDGEEVIEADDGEEVIEEDDGEEVIEADDGEEVIEADG